MNEALKSYLVALGLSEGAADDEANAFLAQKLASGELTIDKLAELKQQADDKDAKIAKARELVSQMVADAIKEHLPKEIAQSSTPPAEKQDKPDDEKVLKVFGNDGAYTPVVDKSVAIRVKDASERYDSTKAPAVYRDRSTGQSRDVHVGGEKVYHLSDLERAQLGCYWKWQVGFRLSDHERSLLLGLIDKGRWTGEHKGQSFNGEFLPEHVKAPLVDDSTSGGTQLVPEFFDTAIIMPALLSGELLPHVQIVPVPRGKSIQGAAFGSIPTLTWNTAEGTAVTEFDATSLISAFDNTAFEVNGFVEIGRHLESDTPYSVADLVLQAFQKRHEAELDKVIATGDGTTQPQGLDAASGTVTTNSTNSTAGPVKVDDAYTLFFGCPAQYRREPGASFVMNDTTYNRFISISVTSSDERRVFPMDPQSFTMLGAPVRLSNDLSNSIALFGPLSRYRLYRRLGVDVTVTSEGKSLALARTTLVGITSRWAGKLTVGGSFAKMADLKA